MQVNFHYYATYCAAYLAGYSHEDSLRIAYFDFFTDECTETLVKKLRAPMMAVTSQYVSEMVDDSMDFIGHQKITRIWSSFHFLPYDLYADREGCGKTYLDRYRLICKPNGKLIEDTVNLAKKIGSLESIGIAMHVLADTWSHSNFAGTPSNVINNVNSDFTEIIKEGASESERKIEFATGTIKDDADKNHYGRSLNSDVENSLMNLGHGRAGHIPDYSFMRFRYQPSWNDYGYLTKDNPSDYYYAFVQMIYAMKYLRGEYDEFRLRQYDDDAVGPWEDEIKRILETRKIDTSEEWNELCGRISGHKLEPFDIDTYQQEFFDAPKNDYEASGIGRFIIAAVQHKSMVVHKIFESGNLLAGVSVDINGLISGIRNIKSIFSAIIGEVKHD